jgi:hypothetical protein
MERTIIKNNNNYGINFYRSSTVEIYNSLINNNYNAGLYLDNAVGIPVIRNCTICDNDNYGIKVSQAGADPNIANCIIKGNDTNDLYRINGSFNRVRYSCLQHVRSGAGNFVADPCFKAVDDFHLTKNSRCRNAGNPNLNYENEFDIDDQTRVQYGRIDIGCDEFFGGLSDYAPQDGIVNFLDYRYLAANWLHNETNYSIDEDNDVDIYDLTYFANEWLWQEESQSMMLMSFQSPSVSAGKNNTELMLTSASSLANRSAKLIEKTEKFYSITSLNTISAKQKELESIKNQKYLAASQSKEMMIQSGLAPAPVAGVIPAEAGIYTVETDTESADVNELLNWIDDLWQNDEEIRNSMTEQEYLDFRNALQQSE